MLERDKAIIRYLKSRQGIIGISLGLTAGGIVFIEILRFANQRSSTDSALSPFVTRFFTRWSCSKKPLILPG